MPISRTPPPRIIYNYNIDARVNDAGIVEHIDIEVNVGDKLIASYSEERGEGHKEIKMNFNDSHSLDTMVGKVKSMLKMCEFNKLPTQDGYDNN